MDVNTAIAADRKSSNELNPYKGFCHRRHWPTTRVDPFMAVSQNFSPLFDAVGESCDELLLLLDHSVVVSQLMSQNASTSHPVQHNMCVRARAGVRCVR